MARITKRELWGDEFILKKHRFYQLKEWDDMKRYIRKRDRGICQRCGMYIRNLGEDSIVDHIIELCPENFDDEAIRLGEDNLQLLCKACHNIKTFGKSYGFDLDARSDINLFDYSNFK